MTWRAYVEILVKNGSKIYGWLAPNGDVLHLYQERGEFTDYTSLLEALKKIEVWARERFHESTDAFAEVKVTIFR
jgi:hypothetical protein